MDRRLDTDLVPHLSVEVESDATPVASQTVKSFAGSVRPLRPPPWPL